MKGSMNRPSATAFLAIAATVLAFAVYTNHIWEDYYITYRASKNLAEGNGLVFTVGQRVHSYTSPLGALIPAALSAITGNRSDMLVLWLFRLIDMVLLGISAVLMVRMAEKTSLGRWAVFVMVGLFASESKILDFSVNGQETSLMIVFMVWLVYLLTTPPHVHPIELGLTWAGLMWSRPDSFVYIGAISAGFFLFSPGVPRKQLVTLGVKAGIVAAVLYLPWTAFTWVYYGTPVPHPLVAKSLRFTQYTIPGSDVAGIVHYIKAAASAVGMLTSTIAFPLRSLGLDTPLDDMFAPPNAYFGGWHYGIFVVSKYLSWTCAFYWVLPFGRKVGRATSFAFMGGALYLNYLGTSPAPWYIPNCAILGLLTFGQVFQHALDAAGSMTDRLGRMKTLWLVRGTGAVLLGVFVATTVCAAWQLRIQQREIEEGVRQEVGLWLRDNARTKQDTVFLEPLGYIGYFSQLKMYDWPGLSSPEMVAARKTTGGDEWPKLITELKPDWLVLRPKEAARLASEAPALLTNQYSRLKVFDASTRIAAHRFLPGRTYVEGDQAFEIYHRVTTATQGD